MRESEHKQGRDRVRWRGREERPRKIIPSKLLTVSTEPDLTPLRPLPEPKSSVGGLTNLATKSPAGKLFKLPDKETLMKMKESKQKMLTHPNKIPI